MREGRQREGGGNLREGEGKREGGRERERERGGGGRGRGEREVNLPTWTLGEASLSSLGASSSLTLLSF